MFLDKGQIDLGQGILMFSHHNNRAVPVEQENLLRLALQEVFLGGQVKIGIGIWTNNTEHRCT
jgi:hypothetical protein